MLKDSVFLVVISSVILLPAHLSAYPQAKQREEVQLKITYCNLEVPSFWKQANANFYLMYSFKVNEKGELIDIKKIRDKVVGEEKVKSCFASWKILGVRKDSDFVAVFRWRHGKGWVEQTIFGKGFKQVMSIEGVGY